MKLEEIIEEIGEITDNLHLISDAEIRELRFRLGYNVARLNNVYEELKQIKPKDNENSLELIGIIKDGKIISLKD